MIKKNFITKWLDHKQSIWLGHAVFGYRLNWFQRMIVARNNGWKQI